MTDMRIEVMEGILDENSRIAGRVSHTLHEQGIFCVNVMGAPGAGKTASLIRIMENLKSRKPCVIEGDIESDIDTLTLRNLGVKTLQINTGGACHLDAPLVEQAISDMEPTPGGILFIENIGNLVCPAEFMIGEDIKLLVSTITEGSDKPYKYPLAFEKADCILLNKMDLLPYLDFDESFFLSGVRALNRHAPVFKVSARTGEGFREAAAWIEMIAERNSASRTEITREI
jgi:hydrogenase nickel incorporation protein HypB